MAQLRTWYEDPTHLFPVNKNYFSHREYRFTLPSEAYLRFHSYATQSEFQADLLKYLPTKIDIGAVYNIKVLHECLIMTAQRQENGKTWHDEAHGKRISI
jgi:hypothetical protein